MTLVEARMPAQPRGVAHTLLASLLVLAVLATPAASGAQTAGLQDAGSNEDELVDRVVAIVGDSAVFYSQVQEQLLRLRASGMPLPEDPAEVQELESEVLDEIVTQTLILNAAGADTLLTVPAARLDQEAERAWQDVVARFGTEAATARALEAEGMSIAQYRANQREEIRKGLLIETFVQAQRRESRLAPIEEAEIREFFDRERDNLGERPATLTFDQVVLAPQPSDSVKAASRERAYEILNQIENDEDFADLARRFSDDPGSAQRGGELGWVRRGVMVEEFEDAAFSLGRGGVSDVVDTQFGAHIIQVERIRGAERMVRHILVAAEPTPSDVEVARERATEIREAVASGAPLSDYYDEAQDTGLPRPMTLPMDQLGQLPSGLAQALTAAEEGAVLGPIEVAQQPNRPTYAVVEVLELREAGQLTYEDVRNQIRGILQDERFQDQLIERLRAQTYVDVRW